MLDEIKNKLAQYIRTDAYGLKLEVLQYDHQKIRIELHDNVVHSCIEVHEFDIADWKEQRFAYAAHSLVVNWAIERYLIN
jgi:hypothetical protein